MQISKLTDSEMSAQGVASLPTRPNGDYADGGETLTAAALKDRFDRLPKYVAARLNALIDALNTNPSTDADGSIASAILSGLFPGTDDTHSLSDFFTDVKNGDLAGYLSVGGVTLSAGLAAKEDTLQIVSTSLSTLTPSDRREYRLGTLSSFSLSLPSNPTSTFSCALVFDTPAGNGNCSFDYPAGIRWTGDDIADGELVTFGSRHYTICLWYDGNWEATVRGVDL